MFGILVYDCNLHFHTTVAVNLRKRLPAKVSRYTVLCYYGILLSILACSQMCHNKGTLNPENCSCSCASGFSGDNCESECIVRYMCELIIFQHHSSPNISTLHSHVAIIKYSNELSSCACTGSNLAYFMGMNCAKLLE